MRHDLVYDGVAIRCRMCRKDVVYLFERNTLWWVVSRVAEHLGLELPVVRDHVGDRLWFRNGKLYCESCGRELPRGETPYAMLAGVLLHLRLED